MHCRQVFNPGTVQVQLEERKIMEGMHPRSERRFIFSNSIHCNTVVWTTFLPGISKVNS